MIANDPPRFSPDYYYPKIAFQTIINVEKGFHDPDPFSTIQKFFRKGWYFKPCTRKNVNFYQTILQITNSVTFTHFRLEKTHPNPAHSTCKILKTIAPCDWEYDLSKSLCFPENYKDSPFYETPFNYWDY